MNTVQFSIRGQTLNQIEQRIAETLIAFVDEGEVADWRYTWEAEHALGAYTATVTATYDPLT